MYRREPVKAPTNKPWLGAKGLPRNGKGARNQSAMYSWGGFTVFRLSINSCLLCRPPHVGSPVAHTGMTWSAYRPSDDEQTYGYLVPSNMFAVVALQYVDTIATGERRMRSVKEREASGAGNNAASSMSTSLTLPCDLQRCGVIWRWRRRRECWRARLTGVCNSERAVVGGGGCYPRCLLTKPFPSIFQRNQEKCHCQSSRIWPHLRL